MVFFFIFFFQRFHFSWSQRDLLILRTKRFVALLSFFLSFFLSFVFLFLFLCQSIFLSLSFKIYLFLYLFVCLSLASSISLCLSLFPLNLSYFNLFWFCLCFSVVLFFILFFHSLLLKADFPSVFVFLSLYLSLTSSFNFFSLSFTH